MLNLLFFLNQVGTTKTDTCFQRRQIGEMSQIRQSPGICHVSDGNASADHLEMGETAQMHKALSMLHKLLTLVCTTKDWQFTSERSPLKDAENTLQEISSICVHVYDFVNKIENSPLSTMYRNELERLKNKLAEANLQCKDRVRMSAELSVLREQR